MKHRIAKLLTNRRTKTESEMITKTAGGKVRKWAGERAPASHFLALLTFSLAVFSPPLPCAAQTYKTNDIALPFNTVTAGVASNIIAFANSGGYTAATPYEIKTQDPVTYPYTVSVNFSCPTVTLATASFVFAYSVDGSNVENIPARAFVLNAPASAASANNTNVTLSFSSSDTNFLTRASLPPRLPYLHLVGVTNGNAATLTINRITVRERF